MFAQYNRGTAIIQCYRVNELSKIHPRQKNTKKNQKNILQENVSVSPIAHEKTSVYTGAIEPFENATEPNKERRARLRSKDKRKIVLNLCKCDDENYNGKYRAKTWDSLTKFYGDADTTQVWANPEVYSMPINDMNVSKKHRRKSKTHKKRGQHLKTHILKDSNQKTFTSSENPVPLEKPVISLYRKENMKNPNVIKEKPTINDNTVINSLSRNSVERIKNKILGIYNKYTFKTENMKPSSGETYNNNFDCKCNKHEGEQTGEPFFEVQVNPRDMCLLNPIEIKENIKKYGKPEKNEPYCICPSRGRLKPDEVCKGGICKKAYKNKQMNFNCWCDKIKTECGDATCDITNVRRARKKRKNCKRLNMERLPKRLNKPLLEVQLDMDKLCVVNPREIVDKVINNITVNEMCPSGVCRDAALKHKTQFFCKCIGKKLNSAINECAEENCGDSTRKKKSKFCLFCTRICSKSETWSCRNKNRDERRIKRRSFYEINPNKLYRGKISTQSDSPPMRGDKLRIDLHDRSPPRRETELNFLNPSKEISKKLRSTLEDVNACECNKILKKEPKIKLRQQKIKGQQLKIKGQQQRKNVPKRVNKKVVDRKMEKEMRRRVKMDRKQEKRAAKARLKEIKMMQKKMNEEPLEKNFCTSFLFGIFKLGFKTVVLILTILLSIIKNPKKCYWYVRDRLKDPTGTCLRLKKWFRDALLIKKLQVEETIRGSDTLTILADHFLDSAVYQSLADKGKTKREQMLFEQKSKARKRRIRKREQQAIFSCRHMLLTTLRHTPCLWVYHICPNFYPQCLSFLAVMRSFSRILLFLVAFACWTPCIVSFELCRACLCCFMCTG